MLKTLLATIALVFLPLSAHANIIYNWTGDCQRVFFGSNSPCTHAALFAVTTNAYVPGEGVLLEFFRSATPNIASDGLRR